MFDLQRLRLLHAVSTHGTLAAAAKALHLTPSAISQQMAKLEREASCRLLERNGRRLRLTEDGLVLADHARRILAAVEEAEASLDERRGKVLGTLSVAAFPTAARGLLPGVLVAMAQRYPQLRISLREVEPYDVMSKVDGGDVDIAVAQDWPTVPVAVPQWLSTKDIGRDGASVALSAGHPLAGRDQVALAELADECWIASTEGTICYDWLTKTMRGAGHEPAIAHQAAEFPTQLALVAEGLGVALVPRLAAESVPAGVRIVPVRPAMHRRIFAVFRTEAARRPSVRAFVTALRRQWGR